MSKRSLKNEISQLNKKFKADVQRYNEPESFAYVPCISSVEDNESLTYIDNKCNSCNKIIGMVTLILSKIDSIEKDLRELKDETKSKNYVSLAEQNLIRTNVVYSKKAMDVLCKFTSEEKDVDELHIASLFPMKGIAEISVMEEKLKDQKFSQKMVNYFHRFKQSPESVEKAFRHIATDNVYIEFNLKGLARKRSLNNLSLFSKILFDACGKSGGVINYENQLKKCILKSHNRFYKRKPAEK